MGASLRRFQRVWLVVLVVVFVLAELARNADPRRATILAMAGWSTFAVLFFSWLWQDCGWRTGLRRLGRLAALALVAFTVLLLYYRWTSYAASGDAIRINGFSTA